MFIDIRKLTKKFRIDRKSKNKNTEAPELTVLQDIDLEIPQGEFVSLLGASGCGKTTLLRIVAGLLAADGGTVSVGGRVVTRPRQDLSMVFQNFGLLPWRSVLDNVAFPLEIDGLSRERRYAAARPLLQLVKLDAFEHHYPHELSGGMQQRVGIARALTRNPSALLMDEPFAALDAQTREVLQEDLLGIWNKTKCTVLFVTHSIDEALLLSDRIVIMKSNPGRVHAIVAPEFASVRTTSNVRMHPAFGAMHASLRQML